MGERKLTRKLLVWIGGEFGVFACFFSLCCCSERVLVFIKNPLASDVLLPLVWSEDILISDPDLVMDLGCFFAGLIMEVVGMGDVVVTVGLNDWKKFG